MARIVLDGVTKIFGTDVVAVDDVSLEIADGEFMVLVGPSGCGKSTILRILAGLEEVTAGEVYIGEQQVTDLPPKARDIAMVFQNYALYPHMDVYDNMGFGLKLRKLPKDEIELLSLEATRTDLVALHVAPFVDLARRLRIMGSLALSLCHLAAGRLDAVCSLKPARAVDIAAAQLLVRECGLAIDLFEDPPFDEAPLDVEARSRVVAAGTPALCRQLAEALAFFREQGATAYAREAESLLAASA